MCSLGKKELSLLRDIYSSGGRREAERKQKYSIETDTTLERTHAKITKQKDDVDLLLNMRNEESERQGPASSESCDGNTEELSTYDNENCLFKVG
eukprot:15365437-Ditylum_brightwellii.AAC.1